MEEGRKGKAKKEWRGRGECSNNEKPTNRIIWQGEKERAEEREERENKERVEKEKEG